MKILRFFILLLLSHISQLAFGQQLIIVHSNDHHGHFMSAVDGSSGLAAQATLVKQIREEASKTGAKVLVLSGGDVNTGPPESVLFKAEPDIRAMNAIGYDAMVIGNHEFDVPVEVLRNQEEMANFKFLSANVLNEKGEYAFLPYIVKEIDGKKVAIIGFTTPDAAAVIKGRKLAGVAIADPFESTKELIKKLRKENDLLIALSHLGFYPDDAQRVGDIALAKAFPEIDIIVGGHTHTELHKPVKVGNTHIVQAKESCQFIGRIDIDLSHLTPRVANYKLLPVKGVAQDPEVAKILQPFFEEGEKRFSEIVGKSSSGFEEGREFIVKKEGPLGNLIAQSQKEISNADIAIVNGRGIRKGLPAGSLKRRDLMSLSPFANTLTVADLDGSEVWKAIEASQKNFMIPGDRAYYSKNLIIEMENNKVIGIKLNGEQISNSATGKYRVAVNNYISESVEDFSFFKNHSSYHNTGTDVTEALESYIKSSKEIKASSFIHSTFHSPGCLKAALKNLVIP